MNDELQSTISDIVKRDWRANPAVRALMDDYIEYHRVLALVGVVVTLALLATSLNLLRSYWRHRRITEPGARFRKRVFLGVGTYVGALGLLFALLTAVNAATATQPIPGFTSIVETSTPRNDSAVGRSLITWVRSGSPETPSIIETKVKERLAWQRPKAIVCGLLFAAFVALSRKLWRSLLNGAHRGMSSRRTKRTVTLVAGVGSVLASTLLLVMSIANTQASLAPLSISVFLGST